MSEANREVTLKIIIVLWNVLDFARTILYNFLHMGLMDNLKQLGDLKKMRDQAMEVQKRLAGIKITIEHRGVTVVMTADQKVQAISGEMDPEKVTEAVNEALKQSQKVAADEMKGLMGGMGIPGM